LRKVREWEGCCVGVRGVLGGNGISFMENGL
jgi:hypothetical protein